ncbi:GNAT family N-acetyltransferase [Erysipelothrix anatis]|uniref:GNAT family N-acetyltransferase n=1 Tax=Erysipelothrix anatis TaxID=2683713 RepID=UPI001359BB23|nr:GNAT family protein [Erysipelothrix anatis]
MKLILETERLIIRNYVATDVTDAAEFLMDEETMYYIPETFKSLSELQQFIVAPEHTNNYLPVELKSSGKIIGHISFMDVFQGHTYEIGWVFNKKYQGQGYAFEAAKAIMMDGFSNRALHRIIATAQPQNSSSWKLMERLNMRREAHHIACIPFQDTWWDEFYYAILKDEMK